MRPLGVVLASVLTTATAGVVLATSGGADYGDMVSPVPFDVCGAPNPWVVPDGVHEINVEMAGAQGGTADSGSLGATSPGGLGGRSVATLAVTPGELLEVTVGCAGGDASPGAPGTGGAGAGTGGDGGFAQFAGGGGGGGSAVTRAGVALLVAGGGGGGGAHSQGEDATGGAGGGANGAGADGNDILTDCGGSGGTLDAPGAGGDSAIDGDPGSGPDGGDAAGHATNVSSTSGGGGGGGYFGGGGAGADDNNPCGAGGGGSGFAAADATGVSGEDGAQAGDGVVNITFIVVPEAVDLQPTFTG